MDTLMFGLGQVLALVGVLFGLWALITSRRFHWRRRRRGVTCAVLLVLGCLLMASGGDTSIGSESMSTDTTPGALHRFPTPEVS